jgi:hypothetical protein
MMIYERGREIRWPDGANKKIRRMWQVKLGKICEFRKTAVLNVSGIRELLIRPPLEKLSSPRLKTPARPAKRTASP